MNPLDALIEQFADRWQLRLDVLRPDWFWIEATNRESSQFVSVSMNTLHEAATCMSQILTQNENSLPTQSQLRLTPRKS